MANALGTRMSYSDSTTLERSVIPEVDLLTPEEIPFLKRISGGTDTQPTLSSLSETPTEVKFEWLEDSDPPLQTTLASAMSDTSTLALVVDAATALWMVEGNILLIDTEQVIVGLVTGSTTIVLSKRGHGGSTAATHASGATVTLIGRVHLEGADSPMDSSTYPVMPYNYCQEMTAGIKLSEIEQAVRRFGIDDALDRVTGQKMRRLMRLAERQCFYGLRNLGTAAEYGTYGGVQTYIPAANTVDLSSAGLEVDDLEGVMQTIFKTVGLSKMPDTIVVGPEVRRRLSKIYSQNVTVYRDQVVRRGGVKVDVVDTSFGPLDILMTDLSNSTDLYLLNMDKLGFGPLEGKGFKREMLAKTGTTDKWMISGVYVFQMRASACHGWIKNINTSII